mgnify:CR=1 FL=1
MRSTLQISKSSRRVAAGFTLIEIMVVVALIAVVMAAGAPTLYKAVQKEGFRKTIGDIQEVCEAARREAIRKNDVAIVTFYPLEGRCEGGGKTAAIGDTTRIEMLDVNLREYRQEERVDVRFYRNGTCDEMTLILVSSAGEWRKLELELTTGMVSIDSDPRNWR